MQIETSNGVSLPENLSILIETKKILNQAAPMSIYKNSEYHLYQHD